ncbi:hypothetical protein IEO21_02726 [Rhodonia placenta]|uniref:UvrD-like helicase ATP-binding domain-containing protein n=1 Tax=Rhodonia placenta TaxID=104341 RepID=A0A8H7P722_9APHY|nr:hypothetical protein IEO21_02726 [Postia placenta]
MARPTKQFDIRVFDADTLRHEAAIESALSVLENFLADSAYSIDALIHDFLAIPGLTEFVISGTALRDRSAQTLIRVILDGFPSKAETFVTSCSRRLLERLSVFFTLETDILAEEDVNLLKSHRRYVELACPMVELLAVYWIADKASFIGPRREQGVELFEKLRLPVPTNTQEAVMLASQVLSHQKDILNYYLEILRYPHLKDRFKKTYVPEFRQGEALASPSEVLDIPVPEFPDAASDPDKARQDDHYVQLRKAMLYFDSVQGFGALRILVSHNTDTELRLHAHSKKSNLFHKAIDILRRLKGTGNGIPIYEARVDVDSRLLYHLDFVPEFESEDALVVKVIGIYTHAQLGRYSWQAISRALKRRAREHAFEHSQHLPSEDERQVSCFVPDESDAYVPLVPTSPSFDEDEQLAKTRALCCILRGTTASEKTFLNNILANKDVSHVFYVSPKEKAVIEYPYSCYVLGRSGTGKTMAILFKILGIERAWHALRETIPRPRQVFVTKSRVLATKVQESFDRHYASFIDDLPGTPERRTRLYGQGQSYRPMISAEEQAEWDSDLPRCFSELEDRHFPLFITFNQLCNLLEADFEDSSAEQQPATGLRPVNKRPKPQGVFISFHVFRSSYWAHFPQSLIKGLDSAMVFGEFMGVLKGSEEALTTKTGYLDREEYLRLSPRRQVMFAGQREVIYDLFQVFLKRKKLRGDYDVADRTRALLRNIADRGVPGQFIDFIYVDEAQDNLLIDALCDTAQTISAGSAFRFHDLRAFMWRTETRRSANLGPQPLLFQLGTNYRSHAGIVNCARSIVELITTYWPGAIDILDREKGSIDGTKPIFISCLDGDIDKYESYLFGTSDNPVEFGHQQCILVRDAEARDRLQERLGGAFAATVMTIYESKGLEFDDVVVYDFFADSPVTSGQWRMLLSIAGQEPKQDSRKMTRDLDAGRLSHICRELKHLYVGATRARRKLWIADRSVYASPMREYWQSRGIVVACDVKENIAHIAKASTRQQWEEMAAVFFQREEYELAMRAYERASLSREVTIARAYHLQTLANLLPENATGNARTCSFASAAKAFRKVADVATVQEERITYLKNAAKCFLQSGDNRNAAEAFYLIGDFERSAQLYRAVGDFDDAVRVVTSHRNRIDKTVADTIVSISQTVYLRSCQFTKARTLFKDDQEMLICMQEYGFHSPQAQFLESRGRLSEAAELHFTNGRTLEAISLLLADERDHSSVRRASQYILEGLWQNITLGTELQSDAALSNGVLLGLLDLSKRVDTSMLEARGQDEAIERDDYAKLLDLSDTFMKRHNDTAAALMCLHYAYSIPPDLLRQSVSTALPKLKAFMWYWLHRLYEALMPPTPALGGLHMLTQAMIPEFERGFSVVRSWILDVLWFTTPYRPRTDKLGDFLTPLMRFTSLGFVFNVADIARHSVCVPSVSTSRPLQLRNTHGEYVVQDIARFYRNDGDAIVKGISFVRHLLMHKVEVDLWVLGDFFDDLCASLVIAMRLRQDFSLHGVCLPHSSLLRAARDFDGLRRCRTSAAVTAYIDAMTRLLQTLSQDDASAKAFASPSVELRIFKICSLVVFGINIRDNRLEIAILSKIRSHGFPDATAGITSRENVQKQLVKALRVFSTARGNSDEIVQLQCRDRLSSDSSPPRPPAYARVIIYDHLDELPSLLGPRAPETTPSRSGPASSMLAVPPSNRPGMQSRSEQKNRGYGHIDGPIDLDADVIKAHEMRAGRIIINAWRRYRRHRETVTQPLYLMKMRYQEASEANNWPVGQQYRLVFRVFVPRLIVALECICMYAEEQRKNLKRRLGQAKHEALDAIHEKLAWTSTLTEEAERLQQLLAPDAIVHKESKMTRLRAYAREVEGLVQRLPPDSTGSWRVDVDLGVRGILAGEFGPRQTTKARPLLNTSDMYT